jgi:hypothetical protein
MPNLVTLLLEESSRIRVTRTLARSLIYKTSFLTESWTLFNYVCSQYIVSLYSSFISVNQQISGLVKQRVAPKDKTHAEHTYV